MAEKQISTIRAVFKPWYVKALAVVGGLPTFVQAYDSFSNQFPAWQMPKLQSALDMGTPILFLPWWGWLLVLQAIFVFALFDYIRRNVPIRPEAKPSIDEDAARDINLDLIHLLHFAVEAATYIATERLIETAPKHGVPIEGDMDSRYDAERSLKNFVREVENINGGARGDAGAFRDAMRKADHEADQELESRLSEDHALTKNMNALRDALQLEKRRDAALGFLCLRRRKKIEKMATERTDLIKRKDRRDPP